MTTENRKRNRDRLPLVPMSVSNTRGLVPTAEYFDHQRTSEDTSGYKVLGPGDFAYNPARINVGSVAWNQESKPVIVSPMYVSFSVDQSQLLNPYLMYFLRTAKFTSQVDRRVEQGARFRFPYEYFQSVSVCLPPVEIQRAILNKLNRFEALSDDIAGALPKEIEFVTNKYEYYRDKLLSFDRSRL